MSSGPITLLTLLVTISCVGACASEETPKSGSQVSSVGTVSAAIGVTEKKLTGFYHFKQMEMPDRSFHADCKIFFSGDVSAGKVFAVRATAANSKAMKPVSGTLTFNGYIKPAKGLPAEQSYTLVLAEHIPNCTDNIGDPNFGFEINKLDNWKLVSGVGSKRAYFHSNPHPKDKKKSFLVAGDPLYIYEEKPEWYFVKYRDGKKETTGWIKKTDAITMMK